MLLAIFRWVHNIWRYLYVFGPQNRFGITSNIVHWRCVCLPERCAMLNDLFNCNLVYCHLPFLLLQIVGHKIHWCNHFGNNSFHFRLTDAMCVSKIPVTKFSKRWAMNWKIKHIHIHSSTNITLFETLTLHWTTTVRLPLIFINININTPYWIVSYMFIKISMGMGTKNGVFVSTLCFVFVAYRERNRYMYS